MTPQLVHRFTFPARDAIEALLGDAVGDCEGWCIRIEGDEVVVDVVAPVPGIAPTIDEMIRGKSREEPHKHGPDAEPDFPADEQSGETSPAPSTEKPKGGRLAQRAGILCNEGGFRVFLEVDTPEQARAVILERCRVNSRAELDHDAVAASLFRDLDQRYRMWLDGVE